jgi:hypothetical protein
VDRFVELSEIDEVGVGLARRNVEYVEIVLGAASMRKSRWTGCSAR